MLSEKTYFTLTLTFIQKHPSTVEWKFKGTNCSEKAYLRFVQGWASISVFVFVFALIQQSKGFKSSLRTTLMDVN
jgi:hypothetical protein